MLKLDAGDGASYRIVSHCMVLLLYVWSHAQVVVIVDLYRNIIVMLVYFQLPPHDVRIPGASAHGRLRLTRQPGPYYPQR